VDRQGREQGSRQAGERRPRTPAGRESVDGWGFSWGWEIGSLETTRWRRDRSVPNVMLRACDWCDGADALLEDARVCSNGHVTASIVQQCESASLVIVLTAANRRERQCRRANSSIHTRRRAKTWSTSTTPPTLSSGVWAQANAAPARHLLQPHSRQQHAVAVPQRPARM
jgi:phage gp46-like protein